MKGRKNTEQDFWDNVQMLGNCWEWQGEIQRGGYGLFRWNGPKRTVHRIAWELTFGPIPDGLLVLHECDNRACCNPSHLVLGTHKKNRNDQTTRGRDHFTHTKLSLEEGLELRRKFFAGEAKCSQLARQYGLNPRTVWERIHEPSATMLRAEREREV
jgi:hypothetical protein